MIPISDDNPRLSKPLAIYGIIIACATAWLIVQEFGAFGYCEFGLIPEVVLGGNETTDCSRTSGGYFSLLSHAFMHADWAHIIFNLWMLFVFGDNIEDLMGSKRFLLFYLSAAVFSGLVFALSASSLTTPLVGASGAISGVLAAYFWIYPRVKVTCIIPIGVTFLFLRLSSWMILGYWAALQFFYLEIFQSESGPIAFSAHVGGLIFGSLFFKFFLDKRLVEAHKLTGWNPQEPNTATIPMHFKLLNYCFAIGSVIVFVKYLNML